MCYTFLYLAVVIEVRPVIILQPQNITEALFSTVQLTCLAEGSPHPEIHWYKDGTKVAFNSNTSSQLVIEELRLETVVSITAKLKQCWCCQLKYCFGEYLR